MHPFNVRTHMASRGKILVIVMAAALLPAMRAWVAAYREQAPGVTITTAGTGSRAGITDASRGAADIGTSDAYLSSGDLVRNPLLLNIPLVISAQVIEYNVPGIDQGTHLTLSGQVLAGIYEGTIKTWDSARIKQLNPDVALPSTPIVPLHRGDGRLQQAGDRHPCRDRRRPEHVLRQRHGGRQRVRPARGRADRGRRRDGRGVSPRHSQAAARIPMN